jgi:Zn-dependent M16 (insulinase) family peptidase
MHNAFGFELLEEREIDEVNATARLYVHRRTGARLLSMSNEDENKVFGITFVTPPEDSTGLPHIMEHSVLCGSRKYPLKEPFVELLKGSLNTFLNAFTMPDRTSYPVASVNEKDFYNLVDVYLDAVFFPLISKETLQQEGWHFELEDVNQELTYKGVVFNEMKGAYSSPENLLYKYRQTALFPDTIYAQDSGGNPEHIPDLTYTQFVAFHRKYYHPSNAYIYFYGNDPENRRLELLAEYLDEFSRQDVPQEIETQASFDQPRRVVYGYDTDGDDEKDKHYVTVNWMLPPVEDQETRLGLDILSHVLLGSPASPLRKALTESGLGEDITGAGNDDSMLMINFSAGMKGVRRENIDPVEQLVLDTLAESVRDGFDPDTVAASLNTVEFSLRENNTGSYPRGLIVFMRAIRDWIFAEDPFSPLSFEVPLAGIKARLEADQPYFEELVQQYLLDNLHRVTVILEPDPDVGRLREEQEKQRLAAIQSELNTHDLQEIILEAKALKRRQETPDTPEALATIPRLGIEDLEKEVRTIPSESSDLDGAWLMYHDLFTNEILYLDLAFNLQAVPQHLLGYIPLFGRALVEIGTEKEDYVQLAQRIGRSTGGIWQSRLVSATHGSEALAAWFMLRGKATLPNVPELLAILTDLLTKVKLDNQTRFLQMALEARARKEAALIPGGHTVVNRRLRAGLTLADYLNEEMSGLENLDFLRQLITRIEKDWPGVLQDLESVRNHLINRQGMLINATLEADSWQQLVPAIHAFYDQLPVGDFQEQTWLAKTLPENEGLVIPAAVNYVGKGANLYDLGYRMNGSIYVVNKYLQTTWLWDRIRVQGGAYGGFSSFDQYSGVFTYLSYRDPNLLATLENYDGTASFLRQLNLNEDELAKIIIGVIGDIDAYQLPDAKGYTAMARSMLGITDQDRQRIRDQVLGTTQQDFLAFADVLEEIQRDSRVVVMGSEQAIRDANQNQPDWLTVTRVL